MNLEPSTQTAVFILDGNVDAQVAVNMTIPATQFGEYGMLAYSQIMDEGAHVLAISAGPFDLDYLIYTQVILSSNAKP